MGISLLCFRYSYTFTPSTNSFKWVWAELGGWGGGANSRLALIRPAQISMQGFLSLSYPPLNFNEVIFKLLPRQSILSAIMVYRTPTLRGLAVAQMVFGALMIVFGVASIFVVDYWISYLGFGIWVGIWVSKNKVLALASYRPPPSLAFGRLSTRVFETRTTTGREHFAC